MRRRFGGNVLIFAGFLAVGTSFIVLSDRSQANFTMSTESPGNSLAAADCFGVTDIDVGNFYFNPDPVTINAGCSVRWTVSSNAQHRITSNTGLWDSGRLGQGGSFTYTFAAAGTYLYGCSIHLGQPSQRDRQIIVQ